MPQYHSTVPYASTTPHHHQLYIIGPRTSRPWLCCVELLAVVQSVAESVAGSTTACSRASIHQSPPFPHDSILAGCRKLLMHSSSVHPRYMDNMLIKWSFYTRWIQRLAACNPRRPSGQTVGAAPLSDNPESLLCPSHSLPPPDPGRPRRLHLDLILQKAPLLFLSLRAQRFGLLSSK